MGKCLIIKGADFSAVSAEQITIEDPRVVITVVASPMGGGTTTGTGSYLPGQSITISATPSAGYDFVQWNDGNTNPTRTIVVGNSAETYTAEFAQPIELLTTVDGAYLNGSGEVQNAASFHVHFYKVSVDSVRITCANSGVASPSATSIYALYSGVDENGYGTGLISRGAVASVGDSFDQVVDTSTYKYIGTSDRAGTGGHTAVIVAENTTP